MDTPERFCHHLQKGDNFSRWKVASLWFEALKNGATIKRRNLFPEGDNFYRWEIASPIFGAFKKVSSLKGTKCPQRDKNFPLKVASCVKGGYISIVRDFFSVTVYPFPLKFRAPDETLVFSFSYFSTNTHVIDTYWKYNSVDYLQYILWEVRKNLSPALNIAVYFGVFTLFFIVMWLFQRFGCEKYYFLRSDFIVWKLWTRFLLFMYWFLFIYLLR